MSFHLSTKISEVSSIGKLSQDRLKGIGILTIRDLFLYYPRTYIDFSQIKKINEVEDGDTVCIKVQIVKVQTIKAKYKKMVLTKVQVEDETGDMEITWFNQPYLKDSLKPGLSIIVAGKVTVKYRKIQMSAPLFEILKDKDSTINRILPVYREPEGITSKWIRKKIEEILPLLNEFTEWLPEEIIQENDLIPFSTAIKHIHFPSDRKMLGQARRRLAFDEVFLLQLRALSLRLEWRSTNTGKAMTVSRVKELTHEFISVLPFELTDDQKSAVNDIVKDLKISIPSLRLLEGDVGSGKTIVAGIVAYLIMKAGGQVALMAPTEVLARQHFKGLAELFMKFGLRTELLVGSMTLKEKEKVKLSLAQGNIDCIIGTHALIQDDVHFKNLGFVVIDEQHRFGVNQRTQLKEKGNPHLLNMTATPIPRTLALTLYGDQDLSIIRQMPPGRKEIITRVISPRYRVTANRFVEDQILKGRQVFVICPLVEESEVLEVKAATQEYERLKNEVFPHVRIGLLHGRMKSEAKEKIMKEFKDHSLDILVSTSVIEVGIDVPNASIILIEGAERFGLAQLHQFRGRVGRDVHQSYCLLFTSTLSQQNKERMKAMINHSSGFDLAEIDLRLRGPGEVFGTRQSGIPDLKMAELSDHELIESARKSVQWLLDKDPELNYYFRVKQEYMDFLQKRSD